MTFLKKLIAKIKNNKKKKQVTREIREIHKPNNRYNDFEIYNEARLEHR